MKNPLLLYQDKIYIETDMETEEFRKKFFENLMSKLKEGDIRDIHSSENNIQFTAPVGRYTWNGWNIFNPITSGNFTVDEFKGTPRISFSFAYLEFFWTAFFLTLLPVVAFYSGLIFWGVLEIIVIWFAFYGGTRTISAVRLNGFIKDISEKITNPPNLVIIPEDEKPYKTNEDWAFFNQVFVDRPNGNVYG